MKTPRSFKRGSSLEPLESRIVLATHIWIGATSGGLWSVASNWNGGVPTSGESGGTIVQFNGNISSTDNIAGLVLDELHFTAGGNTINGSGVTLGISGAFLTNNLLSDAGNNTIANTLPVNLSGAPVFTIVAAGKLTFDDAISGTTGMNLRPGSAAGTLTFSGTGANTFTGSLSVAEGTVELAKTGVAALGGGVTIGDGNGSANTAIVRELSSNQILDTQDVAVNIDGQFILDGTSGQPASDTIHSLSLTIGTSAGATVTTSGVGGLGTLTVGGNITVNLSGTGAVGATIAGALNFGSNSPTITVADGATGNDLSITATIGGSAGYTKAGAGTLMLGSSGPTGNITVAAGTLALNSLGSNDAVQGNLTIGSDTGAAGGATVKLLRSGEIGDSSLVTVLSDGVLDLNGNTEAIGSLTLESGTSFGASVTTEAGQLALSGDLSLIVHGTGASAATISGNLSLGTGNITVQKGSGGPDLLINAAIGGTSGLIKKGAGELQLNNNPGDNTYTGNTVIDNGVLSLSAGFSTHSTSNVIFVGDGLGAPGTAVLRFKQSSVVPDTASITVLSDGLLDISGGNTDVVGQITSLPHGSINLGANGSFTSTAGISLGAGSLFETGIGGRLTVAGAVSVGGTLSLSVATPVAIGTTVTLITNNSAVAVSGTFNGLAEGAVFATNNGLFSISYHGGDGNDVTVTAVAQSTGVTILAGGQSATWLDVDGDLVTVHTTKGQFSAGDFTFGTLGSGVPTGLQLQALDLTDAQFANAKITFTAKPTALGGDGRVNIGAIDATGNDLASVTLPGDLGRINAGDGDPTLPGVGTLSVNSFGQFGLLTQASGGSLVSDIQDIGTLLVKGNVSGAELMLGKTGTVKIGGSLLGSSTVNSGRLDVSTAAKITVGGDLLAVADGSGVISSTGSIGSVSVGGSLIDNSGLGGGAILSGDDLTTVTIAHDLVGSAAISAAGKLGAVAIKGQVTGGGPSGAATISGAGSLIAPSTGLDVAIGSINISKGVSSLNIMGGYSSGVAVNADAAIGKIVIGGDFQASNIIVGATAGADDLFGTSDDAKAVVPRDVADRFSTIASLIIKGQALGSPASGDAFGIEAEQIIAAKIAGHTLKLTPGANNSQDVFALGFASPGPGAEPTDLYLREITA